jgi:hypothetical protein
LKNKATIFCRVKNKKTQALQHVSRFSPKKRKKLRNTIQIQFPGKRLPQGLSGSCPVQTGQKMIKNAHLAPCKMYVQVV